VTERDKRNARARAKYATPDGRAAHNKRMRRWYQSGGNRILAASQRKRLYGLSDAAFNAMLKAQAGLCAMGCGKAAKAVDHCHVTGKVRGILCLGCNVGLGFYELLHDRAKAYLERTSHGR